MSSTSLVGWETPERLEDVLTERYHLPICICNDVNAAAVGYYSSQDKVSSLAFLYQPIQEVVQVLLWITVCFMVCII